MQLMVHYGRRHVARVRPRSSSRRFLCLHSEMDVVIAARQVGNGTAATPWKIEALDPDQNWVSMCHSDPSSPRIYRAATSLSSVRISSSLDTRGIVASSCSSVTADQS